MGIIDVIKYEGDNKTFVWKYPKEDFNTGSQLVVHESQEAIFFLNGQALDSFTPGRYELETQNIPLLNKIINLPSGGESPFHAEVYFINLVEQMGISWGTNSKIQFMEPEYGFPLSIGASGEMAIAVREPKKLLLKIVGTEAILSQESLIRYIKSFLQTRIKAAITQAIAKDSLSIFEMDAQLVRLSEDVRLCLQPDFNEYGLELTQMMITTIVKPDGDPIYERFKDLYFRQYADVRDAQIKQQVGVINQETIAKRTVIEAKGIAEKRQVEGYTYQQERGFDVAEQMAQNEAVGEFANMGIGLGMMSGVGGTMGTVVGGAVSEALSGNEVFGVGSSTPTASSVPQASAMNNEAAATQKTSEGSGQLPFCAHCGHKFSGAENFCPQCGSKRS
jgi:membrane protease subunit (stomatin/prohibitin family)